MELPPIESIRTQPSAAYRKECRAREVQVREEASRRGRTPTLLVKHRLEPQERFLVQEFPDAVEERVAHRVVAAADLRMDFGAGDQQTTRDAVGRGNVVAFDANVGPDIRLGVG